MSYTPDDTSPSLSNGKQNNKFKKPMNIATSPQQKFSKPSYLSKQGSTEPMTQSSLLQPESSAQQMGPNYKKFDFVPLSPVEEASVKSVGTEMKQKFQNNWRNTWSASYQYPTSFSKPINIPHRNSMMRSSDIYVRNMTTDKERREESSTPTEFYIRNPFLSNTPPTPTAGAASHYLRK